MHALTLARYHEGRLYTERWFGALRDSWILLARQSANDAAFATYDENAIMLLQRAMYAIYMAQGGLP